VVFLLLTNQPLRWPIWQPVHGLHGNAELISASFGIHLALENNMGPDAVIQIGSEAIKMVLMISLPMLGVALVVGIAISLFQAVTQIQEMTLTFVPKIIAVFGAMIIAAPWMTERMVTFTRNIFNMIPTLIQ